MIGVSRDQVFKYIKSGELPSSLLSKRVRRILVSDIVAHMERKRDSKGAA